MANANELLKVAAAEVGYRESGTNRTKYASDFDNTYTDWYNGKKNGAAWCAIFVDWCFIKAFGVDKARSLVNKPRYSLGASCTSTIGYWQQVGRFYDRNPQAGDQIFFGTSTKNSTHTGIIEKVANGKIHTIEGNAGDAVSRMTYSVSDSKIVGYGRAKWDAETTKTTGTTETTKTTETATKTETTTATNTTTSTTSYILKNKAVGLDLSTHNGTVDFNKVKSAGYTFVILRAGYGRYSDQKDARFEEYYKGAKAAGLDVGAYWYSYATNVTQAEAEAATCLEIIKGKQFEYPIFYDIEEAKAFNTGKTNVSNMMSAFGKVLENAGYFVGIYSSKYYMSNYYTTDVLERYSLWVAQYNTECTYSGNGRLDMWQKSSTGRVNGISGNVDLDECYYDFPTVIKGAGLNGFTKQTQEPAEEPAQEPTEEPTEEPAVSTLPGDADLDGKVTAADARLILRTAARLENLEGQAAINADFDGDGKITAEDARLTLRRAAGLE